VSNSCALVMLLTGVFELKRWYAMRSMACSSLWSAQYRVASFILGVFVTTFTKSFGTKPSKPPKQKIFAPSWPLPFLALCILSL